MVIGSIAGGRRVAHSLAAKVTRLDHLKGLWVVREIGKRERHLGPARAGTESCTDA